MSLHPHALDELLRAHLRDSVQGADDEAHGQSQPQSRRSQAGA
jgi:hypothetical protein